MLRSAKYELILMRMLLSGACVCFPCLALVTCKQRYSCPVHPTTDIFEALQVNLLSLN